MNELYELKDAPVDWDDRSSHKTLVCVNHPEMRFTTKNPWDRSIFVTSDDADCSCPFTDLRVEVHVIGTDI